MFASPAYAQALGGGAAGGGLEAMIQPLIFFVPLILIFYFLMIRPQSQRAKAHQAMIKALKRGDTVVLNSGVMGKIVRVEDATVGVEIATGVTIKVRKAMISEVDARGAPAPANDAKT
ncbi:MAG: preprotein translocase subunit YajC [Caulobacterales bacterium]|jgi:preprotein translocase subunit YajC